MQLASNFSAMWQMLRRPIRCLFSAQASTRVVYKFTNMRAAPAIALVAATALGCGNRATPPVAPKTPEEPKLDVPVPWIDSAGFYPRGVAPVTRSLQDAV